MKTLFLITIILVACGQARQKESSKMTKNISQEIETHLMMLETPFGDSPHLREKEQSAQWLLAHADEVYSDLLSRVNAGTAGPALVEIIPLFKRTESIPALEALLIKQDGPMAYTIGQALAQHTGAESIAALRRIIRRSEPEAVIAAAQGLLLRGDTTACPDLFIATKHSDGRVRYYTIRAAWQLKCLTKQQLMEILKNDPDKSIRRLAADMISERKD